MQSLSVHKQAARPSQGQRLPNELLLHVIRFLEPTGAEFLSAAHQTTKTLLALMRLCKTTNEAAGSIFSRQCIHLDSEDRTLRPSFAGITSIFLESFLEYTDELEGTLALVEPNPCGPSDLTQEGHSSSRVGEVEEENNDGAEEFAGDGADEEDKDVEDDFMPMRPCPHPQINDLPVATAVHDILIAVAPTLRRLMVNIPLRSLYPEEDQLGVRAVLRQGFESLVNLEEFASVQDELFLTTIPGRFGLFQDEVWATCWPKLRRLYLYNPLIEEELWFDVVRSPNLEVVMTGGPDGNEEPADIKRRWISALRDNDFTKDVYDETIRPLTYINVDMIGVQPSLLGFRSAWNTLDPEERIRVLAVDTPPEAWLAAELGIPILGEPCPRGSVEMWARKHSLEGTLWDESAIGAYDPLSVEE
ncbi:unnamed protein product [Clonostachys rosea f. rosea IK726]|uniref:Uncharacterized protein n=1 Tax=Clonostachys rosea f. rosea IK726 TaxID=1349383 RepID=A0ACA9TQA0_BIOOC|nr:unnamed protein product [Clonostachys rosea f. rosea IK726]